MSLCELSVQRLKERGYVPQRQSAFSLPHDFSQFLLEHLSIQAKGTKGDNFYLCCVMLRVLVIDVMQKRTSTRISSRTPLSLFSSILCVPPHSCSQPRVRPTCTSSCALRDSIRSTARSLQVPRYSPGRDPFVPLQQIWIRYWSPRLA